MKILNKYLILFLAIFAIFFSLNNNVYAQVFSFENNPRVKTAILPAGTMLKGNLKNNISSSFNKIGDKVYLVIPFNVKIGYDTCIPAKSILIGQVIQSQKAKQGKNGLIQIKFEAIQFPDGWTTELSAYIWNKGNEGIIGGEPASKISYRKVPHYLDSIGAVVQLIQVKNPIMGKEISMRAGTELIIVLDNDLEVKYIENL